MTAVLTTGPRASASRCSSRRSAGEPRGQVVEGRQRAACAGTAHAGQRGPPRRVGRHDHRPGRELAVVGRPTTPSAHRAHRRSRAARRRPGSRRGQLLGDRPHARGGDAGGAADERAHQQLGEAARGRELVLGEHARPGTGRRMPSRQRRRRCRGAAARRRGWCRAPRLIRAAGPKPTVAAHRTNAIFSRSEPSGSRRSAEQVARRAHRVGDHEAAGRRDATTAPAWNGLEVEGGEVEVGAGPGVGRVEQLEAVVEQHAVDDVGAHPTADRVAGLEHEHVQPGRVQEPGRVQPRQPGADHHDVARIGHAATLPGWRGRGPATAASGHADDDARVLGRPQPAHDRRQPVLRDRHAPGRGPAVGDTARLAGLPRGARVCLPISRSSQRRYVTRL